MKKTILLSLFALASTIATAQIPNTNIVASYPFNGNASDESVNSNDGTVNGATLTTDRFGNVNSAYEFNGSSNNITGNALDFSSGNEFSISVWVNPVNLTSSQNIHIFRQDNGTSNPDILIAFQNYGSVLSFGLKTSTYTEFDISINPQDFVNGWHHIVATYDGINRKVYVDNVLIGTDNKTGNIGYSASIFAIGSASATQEEYFNGSIDDIRIFNKTLTDCEISALKLENDNKLKITVEDTLNIYLSSIITTVYEPSDAVTTVKVYPNPTAHEVTVEIDNYSNLSGVTIKVLNSLSNEVHNELVTSSTQSIDVSGWSVGVYFLHVINGGHTVDIRKIVVNN